MNFREFPVNYHEFIFCISPRFLRDLKVFTNNSRLICGNSRYNKIMNYREFPVNFHEFIFRISPRFLRDLKVFTNNSRLICGNSRYNKKHYCPRKSVNNLERDVL